MLQALSKSLDCILHSINIEEVCNGVVHPVTKETIKKYTKLINDPVLKPLWVPAKSKELHRLAQGKEGITVATNAFFFLSYDKIRHIPKDRTITYACIAIDHWLQKDDLNRVCITVGKNLIDYPHKLMTQTADMVSSKIMWNSIISKLNSKFSGSNIKSMYLKTPLNQYKYIKMPLRLISKDIIEHYGLCETAVEGYVSWKSGRVCMASHKPASLPASSSNSVLHTMDTSNSPTCLASGNESYTPSGSTCGWMTLASNILVTNTLRTSLLHFRQRCTTLSKIGRAISIVVSLLHETTTNNMLT